MMKNKTFFFAVPMALVFLAGAALADSTRVLPKGRSAITLGFAEDFVTREFDNEGRDRELGYYLNHADVTDTAQAPVVLAVNDIIVNILGGPPPPLLDPLTDTPLDLTMILAQADVRVDLLAFQYQYGITDKLTVGVGFPYFTQAYTDVKFDILVVPNTTTYAAYAPIIAMLPKEQMLQSFLKQRLGYDKLEDFSGGPGIGDVTLTAKYRLVNGEKIKFALGGEATIPTGRTDDEKNLTDVAYGDGSYNLGLAAILDLVPVEPVLLNFTARYGWFLPYHRGVFILDKNNKKFYDMEFPTLHEFGDYDRGDEYELETEAVFTLARGIDAFVGYAYRQSESDKIDGDIIPKSIQIERRMFYGISASAAEAFLDKEAKAPIIFRLWVEPVQTGKNIEKTGRAVFTTTIIF